MKLYQESVVKGHVQAIYNCGYLSFQMAEQARPKSKDLSADSLNSELLFQQAAAYF